MRKGSGLVVVLLAAAALQASELTIYRDAAVLKDRFADGFIGWTGPKVSATCANEEVTLLPTSRCPESLRLCKVRHRIDRLARQAQKAKMAKKSLQTLISHLRYDRPDSAALIKESERLAEGLSRFETQAQEASSRKAELQERFTQEVQSLQGYRAARPCAKEMTVRLPPGAITFEIRNIADITDKKSVDLTEAMAVTNRSGIDIQADRMIFIYRRIARRLRPFRFAPWVVRDANSRPRIVAAKSAAVPVFAVERGLNQTIRKGPRRFEARSVTLPSTGEAVEVTLRHERIEAEYREVAYPWRSEEVYESILFKPPYAVLNDRWRIVKDKETTAAEVYGLYEGERYRLFIGVDEDIRLRRDRLILKESENFFGNRIHKKDGYKITITNQSHKKRDLHIVERIPVAVRSDVHVKLLSVQSDQPLRYRKGKEGRVDIDVTIPPRSSGDVTVLFEVDFDKKKRIFY